MNALTNQATQSPRRFHVVLLHQDLPRDRAVIGLVRGATLSLEDASKVVDSPMTVVVAYLGPNEASAIAARLRAEGVRVRVTRADSSFSRWVLKRTSLFPRLLGSKAAT